MTLPLSEVRCKSYLHAFITENNFKISKNKKSCLSTGFFVLVRETGLEPVWSPTRTLNVRVCRFRHSRISRVPLRDNVDYYNRGIKECQHLFLKNFKNFSFSSLSSFRNEKAVTKCVHFATANLLYFTVPQVLRQLSLQRMHRLSMLLLR